MNLNEEVRRIKGLMFEQVQNDISFFGELTDPYGKKIELRTPDDDLIGYVHLITMSNGHDLDYNIPRLKQNDEWCKKNCDQDFFNDNNSTYLYDLFVMDNYRGQGHSNTLMDTAHNVAKENGLDYVTLITHRENHPAQNLYKKYGYDLHRTDDTKDFYFYSL